MKITYIRPAFSLASSGGSSYSLDLTARTMCEKGHEATVVTPDLMSLGDREDSIPYTVQELKCRSKRPISILRSMVRYMRKSEDEVDLFHIYGPTYLPAGGLYKNKSGVNPVVGLLNGYTFCSNLSMMDSSCHENCTFRKKIRHSPKGTLSKAASIPYYLFSSQGYHRLVNRLDVLQAISPAVSLRYEDIGVDGNILKTIPHFYDPTFESSSYHRNTNDQSRLHILFVGRLIKIKGVNLLIEAVTKLPDIDLTVDIVGHGPQEEQLKSLARSLSVNDQIRFHGRVPHWELPELYDQADVFVHPGTWPEPYGRTVIEALQHQAVPIVSDTGGPPWIIGDAGKTFTPGDSDELANRIRELSDPHERQQLAARSEDRLAYFSPDRIGDKIEEMYLDLLE